MFKGELDALGNRLLAEEFVFIANKGNHIGFAHVHHHLSLVNLSQVHHLVNQVQDSFRVLAHHIVDALSVSVFVFLNQREQRSEDKSQWGTDFVADVHEELQFCFAHLFRMDMLLQYELVFHLAFAVLDIEQTEPQEGKQIADSCPDAGVPGWVNDDGELLDRGFVSVADGLDTELIGTCWHV